MRILRKMGYEGTFIYIFQYGSRFSYMFSWENEIYREEVIMNPSLVRRIGCALGLKPSYTLEQLETAEQVLMSGAMLSIDKLKYRGTSRRIEREKEKLADIAERAKKGNLKEEIEHEEMERRYGKSECMWQARKTDTEEGIYLCLTHDKTVPMDNKIPKHN